MKNIKILICTHKYVQIPRHEYFFPIQAGTDLSQEKLPYPGDNTGTNISIKNQNYCELTCHYWAWKNFNDVDIIGLNHYRRYFDFDRPYKIVSRDLNYVSSDIFFDKPYNFPNLINLLNKYDIIMSNKRTFPYSISTQYCEAHLINDWRTLKEIIRDLSPEYIPAFEKTMECSNSMSGFNMFITKWKYFDEYSEWLFKILFEVENRVLVCPYKDQSRIYGYMSERLINVYCEYKKLKIKHIPIIMPVDNFETKFNLSSFHNLMHKIKNTISFKIARL